MTHYEILGIERTATQAEVRGAYRKLALKCHPDQNHGDPKAEARFKRVTASYEVLKDEVRRAEYDRPVIDLFDVFAEAFRAD